jgi:hypothetical protein
MYAFVDRPRDQLVVGSLFVLEAMRAWTAVAGQNRCPCLSLACSFSRAGMREVLDDFNGVMLYIHRARRCRFSFGALYEPNISESEAVLLALWADIAAENMERVRAVLGLMLSKESIEPCTARMTRVAAHMATLGLIPAGVAAARHAQKEMK